VSEKYDTLFDGNSCSDCAGEAEAAFSKRVCLNEFSALALALPLALLLPATPLSLALPLSAA
jgi:hypothetical protein